jgi:two-component system chemotaxis response regulator CheB
MALPSFKTKIMIVDDSALVRTVISDIIKKDPDLDVIATAKTGRECIDFCKTAKPDLIILDIEMPEMDGLQALEEMNRQKMRVPVLMLSVLTQHGAEATFRALDLGAIDFVPKPSSQSKFEPEEIGALIIAKIKGYFEYVKKSKLQSKLPAKKAIREVKDRKKVSAVVIGTSTGGPRALQEVLTTLPRGLPFPIFVVQHMPSGFTKAFSERMNRNAQLPIKEAEHGEIIKDGEVYIAPGDFQMKISKKGFGNTIELEKSLLVNGHRPSIEVTFDSARSVYGATSLIGVIMTGMGKDGSVATKNIHDEGGITIAQDEESSIVYGMNRHAIEIGGIDHVVPLGDITKKIIEVWKERGA